MSFLSRLLRRRKYSSRPRVGISFSLKRKQNSGLLRYRTHAARTRRRYAIFGVFIIILLSVVSWFVFRSSYFQIKQVTVSNQTALTDGSATALLSDFLGQNIFLTDFDKVREKIISEYPTIEDLSVSRRLPDRIRIRANDYPVGWILTQVSPDSAGRYLLNTAGFIAGPASSDEAVGLPTLELHSDQELSARTTVLPPQTLKQILVLGNNIQSQLDLNVIKYKILDKEREIHLLLENDWVLWLAIDQDWDNALVNLAETLRGQDFAELDFEYIDLRIPSKIFLKKK